MDCFCYFADTFFVVISVHKATVHTVLFSPGKLQPISRCLKSDILILI